MRNCDQLDNYRCTVTECASIEIRIIYLVTSSHFLHIISQQEHTHFSIIIISAPLLITEILAVNSSKYAISQD